MRKNILFIDNGTEFRGKIIDILVEADVNFCVRDWWGLFPEADYKFAMYDGVIFSGSKQNVFEDNHPRAHWQHMEELPKLLICYSQQLYLFDNHDIPVIECNGEEGELEESDVLILNDSVLFEGIDFKEKPYVYHYHWYIPQSLPSHYKITTSTEFTPFGSWENEKEKVYAFQWHPEVLPHTKKILHNFINLICQ
tara:strand:- start:720 stop:1304 length:585 start_codon:yes stop_codon:yes gene_type:complete